MISRRLLLKKTLMLSALVQTPVFKSLLAKPKRTAFRIGACDWSIGKGSNIEAFDLAKKIGLEGIMVDMGSVENDLHIRKKELQTDYLKASAVSGIAITSLAMGVYNRVPFHSDSRTEEWVTGSIDATKNLGVQVLLLAFFNASDLRNDAGRKQAAVDILKKLAPYAEKKSVILGIESYLDAKEHMEIIDKVGSPNLKVYYDFRNTQDAGHDTIAEFKKLDKNMICELHMKENGSLLENGPLNWKGISEAIYEIGYTGNRWMQIEGAIPKGGDTIESYRKNLAFLKGLFS
ncbi:MAG: sugar phosphate isomerase/epimerase [Chitinophagaceae bacterium]|nr:sugar phosphate isomerase/epimerase [Chitinophagaceae bacterium]MCW5929473.1 sugar phosphate isomerase/epimerase [Chitinophagaceae bacterium]